MQPVVHKTCLNNGIRIITGKIPYFRSVSMGVWVSAGSRDESDEDNGISHFIEHMTFKGTARRSAFQIAREFDAIGSQTNAFTSMETTCYHARVSDTHILKAIEILSDIMLNSIFDDQEIERERAVIYQEIGMIEDSPEEYIHVLSEQALWGHHPLGRSILGTRENILRFDTDALRRFFKQCYRPENIVISLAGNLEHEQVIDWLASSFENLSDGVKPFYPALPCLHSGIFVHHKDLEQLHVCLAAQGLPITDSQRYIFSLMNIILGGNMSSRLIQNIREQRGLAYSVYSFISSYTDTGVLGTCAAVDPANAPETVKLMVHELRRLKTEAVSDQELSDAKEYVKGSLFLTLEGTDSQMIRLAQNEIHFRQDIPIQEVIQNIEAVSKNDILDLAKTLLEPEKFCLTLLGPVEDKRVYELALM